MTAPTTFEFASPEWLDGIKNIFEQLVRDAPPGELDDVEFTFCEVYTDIPAHLSATGTLAWHVHLKGGELTFALEEAADADVKIISDYATVLPFVGVPFEGSTPPPELMMHMISASADGKFQMVMGESGKQPPPAFGAAHNTIAAITTVPEGAVLPAAPPFDPDAVLDADVLDLDALVDEVRPLNKMFADMAAGLTTPDKPGGVQKMREAMDSGSLFGGASADTPEVRTIDGPAGPIPIRVFVSDEVRAVYLDIHGGGWCMGSAAMGDAANWQLARAAGVAVVSVDYRLAPEFHFPAPVDDCEAAAVWLMDHVQEEFGADRVLIGGASAGAHLAVLTLLRLRDRGYDLSRVLGMNLVVGVYDLTGTPSQRLSTSSLSGTWDAAFALTNIFCPQISPEGRRDPSVSPLYADLSGLPPALFTAAGLDALRDDSLFMAARWQAAGNEVDLVVFPESVHIFTGLPTKMAAVANARIERFVRDRVGASSTA